MLFPFFQDGVNFQCDFIGETEPNLQAGAYKKEKNDCGDPIEKLTICDLNKEGGRAEKVVCKGKEGVKTKLMISWTKRHN